MNLFFPSHDIALGNGVKHFNPPKAAQMLQEDLAWLEEIFSPNPESQSSIDHSLIDQSPISHLPWGWDWDTRQYLHKEHHIPLKHLPNDEDLEELRQLSNRKQTIQILEELGFEGEIPQYLSTIETLDRYIEKADEAGRDFVLKTPWSSSGRGLIRSSVTPRDIMRQRAMATIQKMGGIMAEHWFSKTQDFAMLFFVGHKEVSFLGYSLFDNEESGTYRQGYLLSNEEIENRLTLLLPDSTDLVKTRIQLLKVLNKLFTPFFGKAWPVGYIGIDMMVTQEGLHPCVELNLRCTMGVVARLWSNRNLKRGESGHFIISPMDKDGHFEAQFLLD